MDKIIMCGREWRWTRAPESFSAADGKIEIVTKPHTDLWQRTYYHFRNDSAPLLQTETDEKFFSFTVKTQFKNAAHRFDQCGVAVYYNSENWLKGSCEHENNKFQHLGSVVTASGFSDWATTAIGADVKEIWTVSADARMIFASNVRSTGRTSAR